MARKSQPQRLADACDELIVAISEIGKRHDLDPAISVGAAMIAVLLANRTLARLAGTKCTLGEIQSEVAALWATLERKGEP